jgi:hypothetical protein
MATILTKDSDFFAPEKWPHRPYCTDDLESGLKIRPLELAFNYQHIQLNPPHLRAWLVFDVDRPGAAYAWEGCGKPDLPHPSWAAINGENAHAHLVWGLAVPVLVNSTELRLAPLRYLCAIETAYREALRADPGYSGLITKNPKHSRWKVLWGYRADFTLDELAEYIDLKKFVSRRNPEEIGLGRNVTVFEWLRRLSYRSVRNYKGCGISAWNDWVSYCNTRALERNGEFRYPLDGREVWHIARSVAKWTWQQFDIHRADQRFAQLQAIRGKKGGQSNEVSTQAQKGHRGGIKSGRARLEASEDLRASARLMHAKNLSVRTIAEELDIPKSTVARWLSEKENN